MGITVTLPFQLQNNTTADATQVMANYNALVTGFTSAAAAGVNSDITSLTALTTPLPAASGGSTVYIGGTSTGAANAQVVASPSPISFTLTVGWRVVFVAGFSNTTAMTLNVNAQGAKNVFRMSPSGPQALTGGEIIVGNIVEAIYDGTQFELLSVHNQFGGFGLLTTLSSAAPDLGTIPSHNISISGTTTITAFGSTASTTFPQYRVTFQGALTLTHNATSLIIPGGANITTAANDVLTALYLGSGNWQVTSYVRANGTPVVAFTNATRQVFLSGTAATYTTPAGARQLKVRMIGGGGGGGAVATNNGANGVDTQFNQASVPIIAAGGTGGALGGNALAGQGGTAGSGTASFRISGGNGAAGGIGGGVSNMPGGHGGSGAFGGAGNGGRAAANSAGGNAAANTGGGGGGGTSTSGNAGQGGGSGEYVEIIYNSPSATYQYSVGAGGAGGAAGTAAGGNGGSGIIIVDEFY